MDDFLNPADTFEEFLGKSATKQVSLKIDDRKADGSYVVVAGAVGQPNQGATAQLFEVSNNTIYPIVGSVDHPLDETDPDSGDSTDKVIDGGFANPKAS